MSKLGADKAREKRSEDATRPVGTSAPAQETLYRLTKSGGGLLVEEVLVDRSAVRSSRTISHEIFDLAFAKLSALVHRRFQ